MSRNRIKAKTRREQGPYIAIPLSVLNSGEFTALSCIAVKLLLDLNAQYRGNNNGDLCLAWTVMVKRGWRSRETLDRACKELTAAEFIVVARQGGRNLPSLYALTYLGIDECKGKIDIAPTVVPPSYWKKNR